MTRFEVQFYEKENGEIPVEAFLISLDVKMRAKILTNGFVKKTQKTPKIELEKAKSYRKDYLERCGKNEEI